MAPSNKTHEWTFLDWLADLDRWSLTGKIGPMQNAAATGAPEDFFAWLEMGSAWLNSVPKDVEKCKQLGAWIADGAIDPLRVLRNLKPECLLRLRLNDKTSTSLGSQQEYEEELHNHWFNAVGPALIIARVRLDSNPENGAFLQGALAYFSLSETCPIQNAMDASHEGWLQDTCEEHTWARETIALRMIKLYSGLPPWPWVFTESLKDTADVQAVRQLLTATDPYRKPTRCDNLRTIELHKERMALFRTQVPRLSAALDEAHRTYESLWGPRPQEFEASRAYLDARAQAVHTMFRSEGPHAFLAIDGLLDSVVEEMRVGP